MSLFRSVRFSLARFVYLSSKVAFVSVAFRLRAYLCLVLCCVRMCIYCALVFVVAPLR